MRNLKLWFLVALVVVATGCSCRSRRVGDGNIPLAEEGGPLADVRFAFDSYALDSKANDIISGNAQWLKENPDTSVTVEGHCDERGTNEYNMALGANRARAAADALRAQGIAEGRISTVSYGEELPIDPRHTEEAYAKNRRAHFRVKE